VLESVTWRASPDWAELLGLSSDQLVEANRAAIDQLDRLRAGMGNNRTVVVSGCIGPRGDGYDGTARMDAHDAEEYHAVQARTFADSPADMVHAMTITYPDEAIGIVEAARHAGIPVAVSFTVETDGRLPDGTTLGDAIQRVDEATEGARRTSESTARIPPTSTERWTGERRGHPACVVCGRTPRASRMRSSTRPRRSTTAIPTSWAASTSNCAGDAGLTVLGGCCGTDVRHVRSIAAATAAAGGTNRVYRSVIRVGLGGSRGFPHEEPLFVVPGEVRTARCGSGAGS
jgi:S-methylmethionine-dependent homocysteine/selenocysteine methylase